MVTFLFCFDNALVHVIYPRVPGQCSHTIHSRTEQCKCQQSPILQTVSAYFGIPTMLYVNFA